MVENFVDLAQAIKKRNLLAKYGLSRIGVFGSFVRGEAFNDIDFCVDLAPNNFSAVIELKRDLENVAGKPVDIMVERYANPIVFSRAVKEMKYVSE
jgi:predicted nucleotidyltransferase